MKLKNCNRCKLYKTRTQVVLGKGSKKAKLVFIGEAPGRNEDEQGRPFVGRAGEILDVLIKYLELKSTDYYVTNIVKCRPPNNRDPFDYEKEKCKLWLLKELGIIKPKLIVALGRHAQGSIAMLNAGWDKKINVFSMIHPAALLHNRKRNKPIFLKQSEELRELWQKIKKKAQV